MIAFVEVRAAIRIPVGEVLDGKTLAESIVIVGGRHEISKSLIAANEWAETGRVELISIDGHAVHWDACCGT